MDIGQMNMMAQMLTGATGPVAASATSATATPLVGDQKAGDSFAGMLLGISPQTPGQPAATAGPTKTGNPKVPDEIGKDITDVQQDVKPDDMLAMLLTMIGSGSQLPPNVVTGPSEEPAESKQPDPSPSQDVALYAAGAQVVLPAQINGRMPESDGAGQVVGDAVMALPVVGTVTSVVPLQENTDNQTAHANGTTAKVSLQENTDSQAAHANDTTAKVSLQKNTGSQAALGFARSLSKNDVSDGALANVVFREPFSRQPTGSAPLEEGGEIRIPLQQPQQAAATQPEVKAVQTPPPAGTASAPLETAPKPEIPMVHDVKVMQPEAPQARATAGTGKLTEVTVAAVPLPPEMNTNQPPVAEPAKEVAKLHTATLPHEAVLAGNQPHVDSTPEKPAVMAEHNLKAGVAQQTATTKEGLADGSDSGTSGEKFEGFLPKLAETPANGIQQMTGGHQVLFTEALGSATPQSVQATAPGPVNHEPVASQVQEQLANHNLKPGNDQITFKLSPEHLGDIKVNLSLQDQRLRVEIVAENRVARDSLLQHVDSLKESLARQNISVEKFDVTTGGGSNTGSQGNNAQGEWRELVKNRQAQQWQSSGGYRTSTAEAVPSLPVYQAQAGHAMLDVHF